MDNFRGLATILLVECGDFRRAQNLMEEFGKHKNYDVGSKIPLEFSVIIYDQDFAES